PAVTSYSSSFLPIHSIPCRRPPLSPLFPYTTLFRSAIPPLVPGTSPPALVTGSVPMPAMIPPLLPSGSKRLYFPTTCISRSPLRSEEHTSELQSRFDLVCRLLLAKKN